jgi:Tol biopolymer transport system component
MIQRVPRQKGLGRHYRASCLGGAHDENPISFNPPGDNKEKIMSARFSLLLPVIVFVLAGCSPAAPAALGVTTRVSVSSSGVKGNAKSAYPSISSDGRFVAFQSDATNLVPGDTNGAMDIFVHDRHKATTELVSVCSMGCLGNDRSERPSISADGRYVAFRSLASNLVADDSNGIGDIFVHDRQTGATELVSVSSNGGLGNGRSEWPSISADGRFVEFESLATNLVAVDTNDATDVFVHDRQTGITELVSLSSSGMQGNSDSTGGVISSDGHYVVFNSDATNLVEGDTNGTPDIFVRDRQTGTTKRILISSSGIQGNPIISSISSDGRFIAVGSTKGGNIYVHDLKTSATELVSISSSGVQGIGWSIYASISSDGRYVAFSSMDTNGDSHVFVHDRQAGTTEPISFRPSGSSTSSISSDGRYVAFSNDPFIMIDPGEDANGLYDVFVYDRGGTVSPKPYPLILVVTGLVEIGLIVMGIIGAVIILLRRSKINRNKP